MPLLAPRVHKLYRRYFTLADMRRRKSYYIAIAVFFLLIFHLIGVKDYIYAEDFDTQFDYPLNIDLVPVIEEWKQHNLPKVEPINYYTYVYLTKSDKCQHSNVDLLILVKSATNNFEKRNVIRKTWGKESFPGKNVKVLFFLGLKDVPTQELVNDEVSEHADVIQMNFMDTYFNNTVKTVMAFGWAYQFCDNAKYFFFSDDDMYVSVKNIFKYIENYELDLPQESKHDLYAGYVFQSRPLRQKTSKWSVSLDEYKWNKWPPYVTAMAYLVSKNTLDSLYLGSLYVKHFRFDDVYLGIVAKKIGIVPTHCPHFYFYKKPYDKFEYRDVIASHGYGDADELVSVWTEQNSL